MTTDQIDYDQWIEDALRSVVRRALSLVESQGLPGEHHFFITFDTTANGVQIPGPLRAQYPEEMTIVLQHQYENLEVGDDAFMVTLRFNGQPARLRIPFATVTSFTDPSVKFGLQYTKGDGLAPSSESSEVSTEEAAEDQTDTGAEENDAKTGEVITLDTFRKK